MQRVNRHIHCSEETPNVVALHIGNWIPLHQAPSPTFQTLENRINLDNGDLWSSSRRLILALAGYPCAQPLECPPQRPNLPHTAALLVAIFIEREKPLASNQSLYFSSIWKHVFNTDPIPLLHFVKEFISLRVQPPGVQAEYPERPSR